MVTKYRDATSKEDITGSFKRALTTFDGATVNDTFTFQRGFLDAATPQQLTDLNIEAYEYIPPDPPAPSTDPRDYPLSRRQLRLGLLGLGITDASVKAAIEQIEDGTEQDAALIEWEDADEYNYEHPLVTSLMASVGLDSETAAPAWLAAKDL